MVPVVCYTSPPYLSPTLPLNLPITPTIFLVKVISTSHLRSSVICLLYKSLHFHVDKEILQTVVPLFIPFSSYFLVLVPCLITTLQRRVK